MSETKSRKAPRYQGRITAWKDAEGFGFITPNGGGPTVFVHIKSFTHRSSRPAGNEIVTYHLSANAAGKPRAEDVAFVGAPSAPGPAPALGAHGLVLALGFLGAMGLFCVLGKVPARLWGAYLVLSVLAWFCYYLDKGAAQAGQWRIPEKNLHLIALAGGWPGALIAQRLLRHKSSKQSFKEVLWATVVFNCIALGVVLSSTGRDVFGPILGLR